MRARSDGPVWTSSRLDRLVFDDDLPNCAYGVLIAMTDYAHLTDSELADQLADATNLDPETALRAVTSDDASLGRRWATEILESRDRQADRLKDLSEHAKRIREYA